MMRFLVVDDDADVRDMLCDCLKLSFETNIDSTHSGNVAKSILNTDRNYDLIVTDFLMEDGTGADLINYMAANNINIYTILFTASFQIPPFTHMDRFLGVVPKPNFDGLVKLIEKHLLKN